jgi:hypothetical protein
LSDTEPFTIVVIAPPQFTQPAVVGQRLTLAWQTTRGHTYRVEFKNDLNDPTWTPLSGDVTADSGSISVNLDINSAQERFYRILPVN